MERYPYIIQFPILYTFNFIFSYKTYERFIDKTKEITESENPEKFISDEKW